MPREEQWYCFRKPGVAEVYVRLVQGMYENSGTEVKCAVEVTDVFKVEVEESLERCRYAFSAYALEKREMKVIRCS